MDIAQRIPLFSQFAPRIEWIRSGARTYIDSALSAFADKHIYRYCSIPEAVALLTQNTLTFAHPTSWPDRYESKLIKRLFTGDGPFSNRPVFAKCFSLEYGSDALWRLNRGSIGLLRLSFHTGTFLAAIDQCRIRQAELFAFRNRYMRQKHYRNALEQFGSSLDSSNHAAAAALAMKREGYYFENEVRVCVVPNDLSQATHLPVVFESLKPSAILLDPGLEPWQADEVVKLFGYLGLNLPIKRSRFNS